MSDIDATPGSSDEGGRDTYCTGRGTRSGDHCCYVNGQTCEYLAVGRPEDERAYVCSLRRDLGSWEAVHADMGYQVNVQAHWDALGTREDGTPVIASCGDWQPGPGECCREER